MKIFVIYLLLINSIAFLSMGIDKYKAKHHKWRIPEKTLFFLAIIGGSIGSNLGMQVFRHKTKHAAFIFGMPCIFIIHILLFVFYMNNPLF